VLFYQNEPEALPLFRSIAPDFVVEPQKGCDLGARMAAAFRQVFSLGHRHAVIIGTDSPDLPVGYLHQAFRELADGAVDVVLGPSADGGYYLLALKRVYECLFAGIAWSTGTVTKVSLARAEEAGLRVKLLPLWHDVDTADDLERSELLHAANGASMTREFLLKYRAART
jgi:rSAM/selenodomain-associated transferase 1